MNILTYLLLQVFFNRKPRHCFKETPLSQRFTFTDIQDLELEYSEQENETTSHLTDSSISESDLDDDMLDSTNQQLPEPSPSNAGVQLTEAERLVQPALARARARIQSKYTGKRQIHIFTPGDFATLSLSRDSIPSSRSLPRIPCRILKKVGDAYQLQTEFGVLEHLESIEVLNPLEPSMDLAKQLPPVPDIPYTTTTTLNELITRARARIFGSTTARIYCNCRAKHGTKRCSTKHCRCQKAKVACTNYCHGECAQPLAQQSDCINLAPRGGRGEAAILRVGSPFGLQTTEEIASASRPGYNTSTENTGLPQRSTFITLGSDTELATTQLLYEQAGQLET